MAESYLFIIFEFLAVLFAGIIALFINFVIAVSRKLKPFKKDIQHASNITIIFFLVISIIVLHIVAFFSGRFESYDGYYNVFSWPSQYTEVPFFTDFGTYYTWSFSTLLLFDTIAMLIATLLGAILGPILYFMRRKSKNVKRLNNLLKFSAITIISIDLSICLEWAFVVLEPIGRTIFLVVLISAAIILPILILKIWRPLVNSLTNAQNKSFSERMKDLTTNFVQVSASADFILEQMKQAIEIHEKEISNRETELNAVKHRLDDLSDQEAQQRKRVTSLVETKPDAEKEFEKMLDRRDRNGLIFSLISLLIGAILGVIAYAIAHGVHLWGL